MKRTPGYSIDDLPGSLPPDNVPKDIDLTKIPSIALQLLENVSVDNLVQDAIWKDWLALTGCVQTYNSAKTVAEVWNKGVATKKVEGLTMDHAMANTAMPDTSWVVVSFTFTTTQESGLVGQCSGRVGLVPEGQNWKIWYITTILENFEGYGHPDTPIKERKVTGSSELGENDFEVVVVGAGQSGLALAGRLHALGIKYLLLERLPKVGQSWTTKYDTVRLHTIREYNNLPFDRTWAPDDEELLPAAKVAEGFQNFATKYNINVWTSMEVAECSWNSNKYIWTLKVVRSDGSNDDRIITGRHLALAMGAGLSEPNRPSLPGEENFRGDIMHMKNFKNSKKWKGRQGLIVGSGTAAHDIAQDMLNNGLSSVTMIQREKTAIYPIEYVIQGQSGLYHMNFPTHIADRIQFAMPQKIGGELMRRSMRKFVENNRARFDSLEQAGFKIDKDAVLIDQIVNRYGGYYIDVGTSSEIAKGNVNIKSGVAISGFTANDIKFGDGTEVKADVVILATGYEGDYRKQAATIVGDNIAEGMSDFWGLDKDGDVRGVMKESATGLWLLGGALPQARFWSRFIALQMQADILGKPFVSLGGSEQKVVNGMANGIH